MSGKYFLLSLVSLKGKYLAFLENIRLVLKGLEGTNTLAYLSKVVSDEEK